jgi:TP901 family phage tail tape measure protein
MATNVEATLGLVITATDEASKVFQDFATNVLTALTGATAAVEPLQTAMEDMASAVTKATEGTTEDLEKEITEIYLSRNALLDWAIDHQSAFGDASEACANFADISTSDLARVYGAVEDMKVRVLADISGINDMFDGPAITAQNKWANTVLLSTQEVIDKFTMLISHNEELAGVSDLLWSNNVKGMLDVVNAFDPMNNKLIDTSTMYSNIAEHEAIVQEAHQNWVNTVVMTTPQLIAEFQNICNELGDLDNLQNLVAANDTKNMTAVVEAHKLYNVIIADTITKLSEEDQKIADIKAATDTWASTSIMSYDQLKAKLVDLIAADSRLSDMTLLLTDENRNLWSKMYTDLTGIPAQVLKIADAEDVAAQSASTMGQHIGLMAKASSMQMLSSAIGGVGTSMTGFIVNAIKSGAEYDNSINDTVVTLNERLAPAYQLTGQQVDALKAKVTELGGYGKFSANDIASAINSMASSGMDYGNIMGGAIKAVQNAAAATDSTLANTAATMTNIYNQQGPEMAKYGATAEQQFGHVSDLISNAMHNANISMSDFNSTMKYTGSVAGGMGLSLDDVATGLTLVGKAGVTGTSAGTYFRQMLSDLNPTTKPAIAEMEQLGLRTKEGGSAFFDASGKAKSLADMHDILAKSVGKLSPEMQNQAMKTMFGLRSMSGLSAMLHMTDAQYNDLAASVGKAGSAQDLANKKMETTQGQLTILHTNWQTLCNTVGERFLPILDALIPMLQKGIDWFNGLSGPMKDLVAGFVAIGGATLLGASKILSFASNMLFLKMAMMDASRAKENDIIQSQALILANERVAASAKEAAVAENALGVGEDVAAEGAVAANGPVGVLSGLMAALTSPITLVIAGIALLGLGFYEAYQHCATFRDGVDTIVGWLETFLAKAWTDITAALTAAWKTISEVFTAAWDGISKAVTAAWSYIGPTILSGVKTVYDYWKSIWPEIQQLFKEVWDVMVTLLGPYVAAFYEVISAGIGFVKGVWNDGWGIISSSFKLVWDAVVDLIKYNWDVISGLFEVAIDLLTGNWAKAWTDMKTTLSNAWNDIGRFLTDLVGNAITWGKNIIQGFIDGITSMIGAVGQAASNVANTVKNFLGFHSPAKMGPGSDSDKWMPNLINMLTDGLNNGVSKIATASSAMAQPISDVFLTQVKSAQDVWNSTNFQDKTAQLNLNTTATGAAAQQSQGATTLQGALAQVGNALPMQGQIPLGSVTQQPQAQMYQSIDLGIAGKASNGTQTNNITINVNGVGKNGDQLGKDIAKQLRLQMAMVTS